MIEKQMQRTGNKQSTRAGTIVERNDQEVGNTGVEKAGRSAIFLPITCIFSAR